MSPQPGGCVVLSSLVRVTKLVRSVGGWMGSGGGGSFDSHEAYSWAVPEVAMIPFKRSESDIEPLPNSLIFNITPMT